MAIALVANQASYITEQDHIMAKKITRVETFISDLSGDEVNDVINVAFTFDGQRFRLDLTPGEAATFEGVMAPYVAAAKAAKESNGGNDSGDDSQEIREWARGHGYDVAEKGRVSASVKAAFYTAQDNAANAPKDDEKSGTRTKKG